jgi:hypothetical protein
MGHMSDLMIDHMNAENREAKYFSRITADHWTAKNKLEEAAKKLAWEMDRHLIPGDKVKEFLGDFEKKMNELYAVHKRCKPLQFSWHRGYTKGWAEWWIYCDGVFQMSLIEVKAYEDNNGRST